MIKPSFLMERYLKVAVRVTLTETPDVNLGPADTRFAVQFQVREEGKLRGEFSMSKGGVRWRRANAQSEKTYSWDQFISLMDPPP